MLPSASTTRPQPNLVGCEEVSLSSPAAVEVDRVSFSYGERRALDEVVFKVQPGEVFGLLGPNGGGKTTLFRILTTLLQPAAGRACIFGIDTVEQPLEARRRLGVVFQNQSLDRRLSVEENLDCQGRLYGLSGAGLRARKDEALAYTRLTDRRGDIVDTLSGGLRRRAELAKCLLHRPDLLLLDEPSTGVDPAVRLDFWDRIQELRAKLGSTVLLTTHLLEEADKCDRLAVLDQGRIVTVGTPGELKSAIGGDVVTLASAEPEAVVARLRERFEIQADVVDGSVRFEDASGAETVARLLRELPPSVDSVTVSKPSLEDVFLHATGRRFGEADARPVE